MHHFHHLATLENYIFDPQYIIYRAIFLYILSKRSGHLNSNQMRSCVHGSACVLNKAWPFGSLLDELSVHESKHELLPSESEPISSDI